MVFEGVTENHRVSILALLFICSMTLGLVFNLKGLKVLTCGNGKMVIGKGHGLGFNSFYCFWCLEWCVKKNLEAEHHDRSMMSAMDAGSGRAVQVLRISHPFRRTFKLLL